MQFLMLLRVQLNVECWIALWYLQMTGSNMVHDWGQGIWLTRNLCFIWEKQGKGAITSAK